MPLAFVVFVACALALELGLRKSAFGLRLRAVGSDEESARRVGVPVNRTALLGYLGGSLLTLLGAIVLLAQLGVGDPGQGTGYTLTSITAVVLGGTSLLGGRGTFIGTLMGAGLSVQVLNATVFLSLESEVAVHLPGPPDRRRRPHLQPGASQRAARGRPAVARTRQPWNPSTFIPQRPPWRSADGSPMNVPDASSMLGPRLRAIRLRRGLSLRELARRLDLSPSTISQIETGKMQPSVRTLYALVSEFGVTVDEVLFDQAPRRRTEPPRLPSESSPAAAGPGLARPARGRATVDHARTPA